MTSRTVMLWLPTPPSTNALFIACGRRRVVSPAYRKWRNEAVGAIWAANHVDVTGPVELVFSVSENVRRDLDNYGKAISDILVSERVIEGDGCKIVRKITLEWSHDLEDGVRVTITPAAPWVKRRGAAKK
jgi:crossover junction endodeoxyribonuclease RusA